MRRRELLAGGAALAGGVAAAAASTSPPVQARRTLRVAFNFAETGFDPPRVGDQSSIRVIAHIFEPPLTYDPLARPAVLVPLTAAALPEASADFRRFVVTLRPGIFFADDPVFQGRPRELVAADYVVGPAKPWEPAWMLAFRGEPQWRILSNSIPIGFDFWGIRGWRRRTFSAAASTR